MKELNLTFVFTLFIGVFTLASCSEKNQTLTVTNSSELDRNDAPVTITRNQLIQKTGAIPEGTVPFLSAESDPVAQQLDDLDGDGAWDELAFVIDIAAQTSTDLSVEFVSPEEIPSFTKRTNVQMGVLRDSTVVSVDTLTLQADELPVHLQFQMDGPAWENDKVGFRHYIDGRNARDVFGKRVSSMALDTVGVNNQGMVEDTYHVMREWGRDILSVGNSLGIGGLAILNNGDPVRLGITFDDERNIIETTTYRLVSEGPVRTIFDLEYDNWSVGDKSYDLTNTVTIWAGKYWHKNQVTLYSNQPSDTLVTGLVNSNNAEPLLSTDPVAGFVPIATHDQQNYDQDQYLGLALLLPENNYVGYQESPTSGPGITTSYNALLEVESENPINYYVLGAWELADSSFADRAYFEEFLRAGAQQIASPVTIE